MLGIGEAVRTTQKIMMYRWAKLMYDIGALLPSFMIGIILIEYTLTWSIWFFWWIGRKDEFVQGWNLHARWMSWEDLGLSGDVLYPSNPALTMLFPSLDTKRTTGRAKLVKNWSLNNQNKLRRLQLATFKWSERQIGYLDVRFKNQSNEERIRLMGMDVWNWVWEPRTLQCR